MIVVLKRWLNLRLARGETGGQRGGCYGHWSEELWLRQEGGNERRGRVRVSRGRVTRTC